MFQAFNLPGEWNRPTFFCTACEATHRQGRHHREAVPGSYRETGSFGILELRYEREPREGESFGRRSLGVFRVPLRFRRFDRRLPGC